MAEGQLEVTGSITPVEATGVYGRISDYNGQARWKHQTNDYWIFWSSSRATWYIAPSATEPPGSNYWQRVDADVVGSYSPQRGATGTAVVAAGGGAARAKVNGALAGGKRGLI